MSLGISEIILILIVVVVLFGGKKLPKLARGIGKAQAEYKKAKEAIEDEVNEFKAEIEKSAKEEKSKKTPTKKKTAKKPDSVKKTSGKKVATK